MAFINPLHLSVLKESIARKNLTIYLGAGVSVGCGLPSWNKLVLAMYFSTISDIKIPGYKPFPNYLFAIAEWMLNNTTEPLEITARKIRKYLIDESGNENKFLEKLYETLYAGFLDEYGNRICDYELEFIIRENKTLSSVAKLCKETATLNSGVKSVITYNYDDLLENALTDLPNQPIFGSCEIEENKLPVFHVHGFVPFKQNKESSRSAEIVFTEDQYHKVARDPYNWSNLIQIQAMTNSVGLMIGLSLSDRNMRRLLDAVRNAPINNSNFALLKKPDANPPEDEIIDRIHERAKKYLNMFPGSTVKSELDASRNVFRRRADVKSEMPLFFSSRAVKGPQYRSEIAGIMEQMNLLELEQQEYVLNQLGILPVWFNSYEDIPGIIEELLN